MTSSDPGETQSLSTGDDAGDAQRSRRIRALTLIAALVGFAMLLYMMTMVRLST